MNIRFHLSSYSDLIRYSISSLKIEYSILIIRFSNRTPDNSDQIMHTLTQHS